MTRFLSVVFFLLLLPAISFGGDEMLSSSLSKVHVPSGARLIEDVAVGPIDDQRMISQVVKQYKYDKSVNDAASFYSALFKPFLQADEGDSTSYEDLELGQKTPVSYGIDYYSEEDFKDSYSQKKLIYSGKNVKKCLKKQFQSPDKAMKSASFSWGEKLKDGWRVFTLEITDETFDAKGQGCGIGCIINISEARFMSPEIQAEASEEEVAKIYSEKLKEFEAYSEAVNFMGVLKYPNSMFAVERSAAMTAENMGEDIFVFESMDDAEIAADFYKNMKGFEAIQTDDTMYVFKYSDGVKDTSVAVTGTAIKNGSNIITEITIIEMKQ